MLNEFIPSPLPPLPSPSRNKFICEVSRVFGLFLKVRHDTETFRCFFPLRRLISSEGSVPFTRSLYLERSRIRARYPTITADRMLQVNDNLSSGLKSRNCGFCARLSLPLSLSLSVCLWGDRVSVCCAELFMSNNIISGTAPLLQVSSIWIFWLGSTKISFEHHCMVTFKGCCCW